MYPVIDYDKCEGVLACYEVCPVDLFDVGNNEEKEIEVAIVARPEDCIECEQCIEACPQEAIRLVEDE